MIQGKLQTNHPLHGEEEAKNNDSHMTLGRQ